MPRTLFRLSAGQNPTIRINFVLAGSLLVLRTHLCDEVAHHMRTLQRSCTGGNPAIRTNFLLAGLLLVQEDTCNQTTAGPNPAFKIYFVLANLLLAQDHSHRLRMNTKLIEIVLDVCMVESLLSTWRRHAARAFVMRLERGGSVGKDE